MIRIKNNTVSKILASYPPQIRVALMYIRELIFQVGSENPDIGDIEETIKWGEPSYITKSGSTLRLGWKVSDPEYYCVYFNCKSKLVDTFKELYEDMFCYEDNRAIKFHLGDILPKNELKFCIFLTLTYHNRKHLPLLGA